ncbi:ImmA/IrrE family metallo-endopeptidase, partial [Streptococcus danieliae]|nr:ImmA/IrrE family metallo-endopeptidase [Streptococcus danieliae]
NKNYVALIRDYLEKFIDFPKLDWDLTGLEFTPKEYAKYIRESWGLGEKPIDNLSLLMEEKGFVISRIDTQSDKVDAYGSAVKVNDNNYYIVMSEGTNYSFYRQQFSLAHELGHWLMHENSKFPQEMGAV